MTHYLNRIIDLTDQHNRVLLKSNTGTGKTSLSIKLAEHFYKTTSIPTIIIVPLNSIAEQQGTAKYKFAHETGKLEGCPYVTAKTFNDEVLQAHVIREAPVIFCNYDKAPDLVQLLKKMGIDKYNAVLDEQPELASAVGFRLDKAIGVQQAN